MFSQYFPPCWNISIGWEKPHWCIYAPQCNYIDSCKIEDTARKKWNWITLKKTICCLHSNVDSLKFSRNFDFLHEMNSLFYLPGVLRIISLEAIYGFVAPDPWCRFPITKPVSFARAFNPICVYACVIHTVYMHIHAPFFLTIPHFDWGSGGNTFGPTKIHRLARKIESWSFLLHFHKGGPLRASETTWKSQIFRPLVGVVLGIWKL